ncbi:MAG: dipeptidase [Pseudomonadales bacterium]|jgi:membrane dipeptidase|nr:dipeptidase [Pseudomonadales bacterium]
MLHRTLTCALGLSILAAGCVGSTAPEAPDAAPSVAQSAHAAGYGEGLGERAAALPEHIRAWLPEAREIAASTIIVDTHIDVPYRVENGYVDVTVATEGGDFDWPRAVAGGLDSPFMSIYIPADVDAAGEGDALALRLIDHVESIVARAPDKFGLARSPDEVVANWRAGRISLPMGMENCGPMRDVEAPARWAARGIRYCSLAHSRSNALSDSSYDINEQWQGLSPLGREMVGALNDAGIMVDVSHLSDRATRQVLELSAVPVIASHSSARRFVPGFQRNLDDELIRAIGAQGGVIMVNLGSTFISLESRRSQEAARFAFQQWLRESGEARDSEAARAWLAERAATRPFRRATLEEVLDHFDHIVGLAGIDAVGIGTDFDGVGDTLPENLMDVASYPHLVAGLLARGYGRAEIAKVLSGNLLRVWRTADAWARGGAAEAES